MVLFFIHHSKKHFLYVRKTRLCFDGDQGLRGLGGRGFFFKTKVIGQKYTIHPTKYKKKSEM